MNRHERRAAAAQQPKQPQRRPAITQSKFQELVQAAGQAAASSVAAQFQSASAIVMPGAGPASDPNRITRDELVRACGQTAAVMVGVVIDLMGIVIVDDSKAPKA